MVVLAGEFLQEAKAFVEEGMATQIIIKGLRAARDLVRPKAAYRRQQQQRDTGTRKDGEAPGRQAWGGPPLLCLIALLHNLVFILLPRAALRLRRCSASKKSSCLSRTSPRSPSACMCRPYSQLVEPFCIRLSS